MKILSLIDYKNIIQRGSFDLIHISLSVGEFNNELVLIKKYPKYSSIHNWKNELLYLNSYEHDNILTFLGFSVIPQEHDLLCLILEYTPLGSLQMVLNRISDIPIPLMLSWNKDILHAMKFIHSKGFNYVDIQLEHIFLFPNMKVKLSSFNQNTEIHSCIEEISKEFYFCLPPEIVNREGYLINSNIYSFAMLMCYLFLDKPFGFSSLLKDNTVSVIVTKTLQWLLDNYLNKKAIPSSFDNFQKNLYNCVDSNPENRPSSIDFYQCMEKFLSDLNYNNRDHAHLFHELASKQTEIHQNQKKDFESTYVSFHETLSNNFLSLNSLESIKELFHWMIDNKIDHNNASRYCKELIPTGIFDQNGLREFINDIKDIFEPHDLSILQQIL